MAVFFRDYMDPTMSVLTSDRGPFWNKKNLGERKLPEAWPSDKPDPEFYRMGA